MTLPTSTCPLPRVFSPLQPGERVGRYRIVESIGEGGCGLVFLAEQEEPIRRPVALKVIKLGMDTHNVLARFQAERQALALMEHPNIAQVLDAGATPSGRPFFVMELLRGPSLTEYCDRNCLNARERLELFVQVCQGIQHAHDKGIIHRDIKPSNVLTAAPEPGAAVVPKIIDFGIAQAISGGPLTDRTLFTTFEQFLGTPAYMSPEQTELSAARLDRRSDVYSLGILLYELLTGTTPFEAEHLRRAGLDEVRRIIREQEPLTPSTRLRTMASADLERIANQRRARPPSLIHQVRGELDWVVMKALEKDRACRYQTAAELALDIQSYLQNRPLLASPPGGWRRLRGLVRRYHWEVQTALAVGIVLISGLGISSTLLARERNERRRAALAGQAQTRFRVETKLRQLAGLAEQLHRQGRLAEAEVSYRHLVELQLKVLGNGHPDVADSLENLAGVLKQEGRTGQAQAVLGEALALRQKFSPKKPPPGNP